MNEQINPSPELVNKVINAIDKTGESPQNQIKSKRYLKPVIKFALPALLIACAFCFQIINSNIPRFVDSENGIVETEEKKSGNWFSLVVYAEDMTPVEITKDMKIKLPGNILWWGTSRNLGFSITDRFGNRDEYMDIPLFVTIFPEEIDGNGEVKRVNRSGFEFEGENMKSVSLESKYGKISCLDENNEWENSSHIILEDADISSKCFHWFPVTLYNHLSDMPVRDPDNNDYQQYLTDTITITVTFDDGEVMTQIAEITIGEETGELFGQIIG